MATKASITSTVSTSTSNVTRLAMPNVTDMYKHLNGDKSPGEDFWDTIFTVVEVISAMLSVFILAVNLLLLALILSSPVLRRRARNKFLLSLVAVFLLLGVFDTAFSADYAAGRNWNHGCYFNVVRSLIVRYVQYFVSIWGVVVLTLHYLLRLRNVEGPQWMVRLPAKLHTLLMPLFIASPWIASVVIMVPLVFGGLHKHALLIWTDSRCPLILEWWATVVVNVLSFFLPGLILIGLVIAIQVFSYYRSRQGGGAARSGRDMEAGLVEGVNDDLEPPLVFTLTAVLELFFHAPEHIFYISRLPFKLDWHTAVITSVTLELFSELMPVVLVLLWLWFFVDLRERLLHLFAKLPCCSAWCQLKTPPKSTGDTSVAPVAFRDLHDE